MCELECWVISVLSNVHGDCGVVLMLRGVGIGHNRCASERINSTVCMSVTVSLCCPISIPVNCAERIESLSAFLFDVVVVVVVVAGQTIWPISSN